MCYLFAWLCLFFLQEDGPYLEIAYRHHTLAFGRENSKVFDELDNFFSTFVPGVWFILYTGVWS